MDPDLVMVELKLVMSNWLVAIGVFRDLIANRMS